MILPTCKHCGQTLPGTLEFGNVKLTPMQKRAVERVYKAGKNGITLPMLIAAVYKDDPEGGPLCARQSVHVALSGANKRLAAIGIQVRADKKGGHGAYYRIVPL